MKKYNFKKVIHLMLLSLSISFLSTFPKANAQLSLFSEIDMGGSSIEHYPEDTTQSVANTYFEETIKSMKLASGYKVTLYAETDFSGPSLVFYAGNYDRLPSFYSTISLTADSQYDKVKELKVQSYELERVESGHVDLWYTRRNQDNSMVYNYYNQKMGMGSNTDKVLIGTPELPDATVWPKLWMNSITIPRGFVVILTSNEGKKVSLSNDDPTKTSKIFNTDQYPDIHKNIARVEVKAVEYLIKKVVLKTTSQKALPEHEITRSYTNETNTETVFSVNETFEESANFINDYSASPLKAKISTDTELDVDGVAIGPEAGNLPLNELFEKTTLTCIEKSLSSGHSNTERLTYPLSEACSTLSPPRSISVIKLSVKPVDILYQVTTTLVRLGADGKEVAGTDFTIKSLFKAHESKVGDCTNEAPVAFADLPGTPSEEQTARVGDLVWMTENLNTLICKDGKPIESDNYKKQGDQILYNPIAVESCDICPLGWRLPTKEDFTNLSGKGMTGDQVTESLNINMNSLAPAGYLRIDDAKVYHGNLKTIVESGNNHFTGKGDASNFHPVRCVKEAPKENNNSTAINNGLHFDGQGDYVDLGKVAFYKNSFTVEGWLKRTKKGEGYFLHAFENNKSAIFAQVTNDDKFRFNIRNPANNSGGLQVFSKTKLPLDKWFHIALVKGDDDKLHIYIDGKLDNSSSGTIKDFDSTPYQVALGMNNKSRYFKGIMDEVRFWNKARTLSEINTAKGKTLNGGESGLVAYYNFDQGIPNGDNSDLSIIKDKKGQYNGTPKNLALNGEQSNFVPGYEMEKVVATANNALHFDGKNDHVNLGQVPFYKNSFTVEGWLKRTKKGEGYFLHAFENNKSAIFVQITNDDKLRFTIRNPANNSGGVQVFSKSKLPIDKWFHIALVKGDDDKLHIYIDGKLDNSSSGTIKDFDSTPYQVTLGMNVNNRYFTGNMDEVRFWNKERTAAEINESKETVLNGGEAGLVAYYNFDQGKANGDNSALGTIKDKQGQYDGTPKNLTLNGEQSNFVPGYGSIK